MSTIPTKAPPERTPPSIGFHLTIATWIMAIVSCLSAALINFGCGILLGLVPVLLPVSIVWTFVDTLKGKKWALLGFVLSAVVPAALYWFITHGLNPFLGEHAYGTY